MKRLREFFAASAAELKSVRSLTQASLLIAIYAVSYSPFAGNFMIVPGYIEFRFGFLALAVAGMLFGPVLAMLVAVLGDVVGTIVFYGGSFAFGYTISWAVTGLIFGCFLYRSKFSTPKALAALALNTVVVDQCLTSLWHSLLGIGPFQVIFVGRILRNLVMYPINAVLLLMVLRGIGAIHRRMGPRAYTK